MISTGKTTRNHHEIQRWAEERGGKPVTLKKSPIKYSIEAVRINFPEFNYENSFETISWEDFFEIFDESGLFFLYQELTSDGAKSRFFKFIGIEWNNGNMFLDSIHRLN